MNCNFKYSSIAPFLSNSHKLEELSNKDFNSVEKTKEDLREYALYMYGDLVHIFNIDMIKIQRLIFAISENYQNNPFHNFQHGFSVTQVKSI